ncbi:transcription antitermination factor NusB, partial [Campylobacter coli]
IEKLGHIERAILRLGAYELLFTDTPNAIVINEAIELAKELANDNSPKFINGVLDTLVKAKQ